MGRGDLTNAEWVGLDPHLPAMGRRGWQWNGHRRVINGILFRVRTGIPWRDLPERFGSWKSVYERHRRWSADGTWDRTGQWGDAPQMIEVLERIRVPRPQGGRPRTQPDHVGGDKAYSSRRNRRYLRRRQIKHTIPEPKDQRANRKRRGSKGGRPTSFDSEIHQRCNEVERTINRLKNSRAVATRYDKRAYIFHGTVTTAAIRLWLRL
ncbi:transposase [Streptomyces griseoluteus]|uniref:Transposase n=1 Tax=Streptomyces griseoluteus TaxID=29306 RepID=A0A4Z1CZM2_STRGP|nr:transposase [Streptomyces griseoluteus]TGN74386.1 transposase [Streptomyces griseoluteus]